MFALGLPSQNQPFQAATKPSDVIAGGYTAIPQKFYHPSAARNALGLVGGNDVTLASGNMVDLESDLRNITRDLSRCPSRKYQPSCPLGSNEKAGESFAPATGSTCPSWPRKITFTERPTGRMVTVNTEPRHLPTMQMVSYPGVPAPDPFVQEVYGAPWRF